MTPMRSVLLVAAASLALFAAMAVYTSPLDPAIPAIQFTFTESGFRRVLDAWRPEDVARFEGHFAIDFPFLACYGALGYLLTGRTRLFLTFTRRARSMLAAALPVAAAADAVENALHLAFLHGPAAVAPALYGVAGTVASMKWLLIAGFVACAAYALATRRVRGPVD